MMYLLVFVLEFLLVCGAALRTTSGNPVGAQHISDKANVISKRTVQKYHSAMGEILAANSHRHKRLNSENSIKRMNLTGTNESADEDILNINEEQKIADDLFEGDVILNPMDSDDFQLIKLQEENNDGLSENSIRKRQGIRQMKRLWHNRIVPYAIASNLESIRYLIENTIKKFNAKSCVHFAPRRGNERDYVIFEKNDGCYSRIGRSYATPGYQVISIGHLCDSEAIITHEMLHAVGFYHEQSRPDRDKYLEVVWENIDSKYNAQFLRYGHGEIDNFGISYNYKSIMHYPRTAFSSTNSITMQAIGDPNLELGNTEMSPDDILELNTLYDCRSTTYNSWTSWSSFGPCESTCNKKRQRYCYGSTPQSCGGQVNEYGIQSQWNKCGADECPVRVDGHWGSWSPWGYCSMSCNEGAQSRTRTCDDPPPSNGGAACPNSAMDFKICRKARCSLGTFDTDFRDGRIGKAWVNDVYDTPGFDWMIGQGSTATEGTGPPRDHSTGNGYYLYVESSGRARNDNARLISAIMPATGKNTKCLKFFYHMFGPTIGSLAVNIYPKSQKPITLFWKTGNQGNKWKPANVTLYSKVKFQLVIECVIAGPTYSDIAIDDLFIDEGDCDCQDEYNSCAKWAAKGDCVNSYVFMSKFCTRICNYCGCRDKSKECSTWGMDECKKNPYYMSIVCPLTCRVCSCHDDDLKCARWAKSGECERNAIYMSKYCRKSCHICT